MPGKRGNRRAQLIQEPVCWLLPNRPTRHCSASSHPSLTGLPTGARSSIAARSPARIRSTTSRTGPRRATCSSPLARRAACTCPPWPPCCATASFPRPGQPFRTSTLSPPVPACAGSVLKSSSTPPRTISSTNLPHQLNTLIFSTSFPPYLTTLLLPCYPRTSNWSPFHEETAPPLSPAPSPLNMPHRHLL